MTKADTLFKENIQNILNKGVFSQQARPKYPNGQTAHSKYITGSFATYDLSKGNFPITNPRSQGGPRFQSGEELANSVGKINAYHSL